jgi:hypothetical protein
VEALSSQSVSEETQAAIGINIINTAGVTLRVSTPVWSSASRFLISERVWQ